MTRMVSLIVVLSLATTTTADNASSPETDYRVEENVVSIDVPAGISKLTIPNFHSPIARLSWVDSEGDDEPKIVPLVHQWEIQLSKPLDNAQMIHLELESEAQTTKQMKPIAPSVDGGFSIPAHLSRVVGKKLRYEPQPWKNTVGYWVNVNDYVYFLIDCDDAGSWNVGVLQGCGTGQGGSRAAVSLHGPIEDLLALRTDPLPLALPMVSEQEFEVAETGHFQNFQWHHVGVLSVDTPGVYAVKVSAKKIAKGAVMDVRAISLTRLPK